MKESEVQRCSVMSTRVPRQAGTAASLRPGAPSLRMATPPRQTGTAPQRQGASPLGPGASLRGSGSPSIGPGAPRRGSGSPSIGPGAPCRGSGSPSIGPGGAPPHGPGPGVPPPEEMAAWTVEQVVDYLNQVRGVHATQLRLFAIATVATNTFVSLKRKRKKILHLEKLRFALFRDVSRI
jgi:hypothetical protein